MPHFSCMNPGKNYWKWLSQAKWRSVRLSTEFLSIWPHPQLVPMKDSLIYLWLKQWSLTKKKGMYLLQGFTKFSDLGRSILSGEDIWINFLSQKRYTVYIDRCDKVKVCQGVKKWDFGKTISAFYYISFHIYVLWSNSA